MSNTCDESRFPELLAHMKELHEKGKIKDSAGSLTVVSSFLGFGLSPEDISAAKESVRQSGKIQDRVQEWARKKDLAAKKAVRDAKLEQDLDREKERLSEDAKKIRPLCDENIVSRVSELIRCYERYVGWSSKQE